MIVEHLEAEAPALQGPAETRVLLICMDNQHILKKRYVAAVKCLVSGTSVEMEIGPMLLGMLVFVMAERLSQPTGTRPLSGYSCVSFYRQARSSSAKVLANVSWILCLAISKHRQVQPTGAYKRRLSINHSLSLKNPHT